MPIRTVLPRVLLAVFLPACATAPAPVTSPGNAPAQVTASAPPSEPSAPPEPATCALGARSLPGEPGQVTRYLCPAGCDAGGDVRGTIAYADGSPLCRAAIHAGAIPPAGGVVAFRLDGPRRAYRGTTQNGITSLDASGVMLGFTVLGPNIPVVEPPSSPNARTEAGCTLSGRGLKGDIGVGYVVWCPPGCGSLEVAGTDVYAFDSPICTAAIHAGLVTDAAGGPVKVTLDQAHPPYRGKLRNGVRSHDAPTSMGEFRLSQP